MFRIMHSGLNRENRDDQHFKGKDVDKMLYYLCSAKFLHIPRATFDENTFLINAPKSQEQIFE